MKAPRDCSQSASTVKRAGMTIRFEYVAEIAGAYECFSCIDAHMFTVVYTQCTLVDYWSDLAG
jgi:hypothetical protein